ncbi:phospholipase D-like domain-containing protein [Deinococcus yunweiensis]|uniref:phospholipase D-like domain-containing protein n=1 Tax=Deinococcus yunweiensis TaxID=367282 RepID=UPI00398EED71
MLTGPEPRNALNTQSTAYMGALLRTALEGADEIHICVSFLLSSGLGLVLPEFKDFLNRGGRLRLMVSTYLNVTQPDALRTLLILGKLGALDLRLQDGPQGFHAKYYMFECAGGERTCWVGSSNFTKSGLFGSVEWNTRHSGPAEVDACETQFETLWARPDSAPLTASLIDAYEVRYRAALKPDFHTLSILPAGGPTPT